MSGKRIIFVRHGQSLSNIGGVTMAHDAIPLTPLGMKQAETLAELLPENPSRVFVSAFKRAQQTATPYCERIGQAAQVHPLIHEFCTIDPALMEGMTGAERKPVVDAYWSEADPAKRLGPEAETFSEFETRVGAFIAEAAPDLPNEAVLFGHGMWIGMLCWKLLGFSCRNSADMKAFRLFQLGLPMPNGAAYRLTESRAWGWRIQVDEPIMRAIGAVNDA